MNKTLVKQILLEVFDTAKDINQIISRPSLWGKDYPSQKKQNLYSTIYRMKEEGYIKVVEDRGKKRYISTLKGKTKILAYLKKDKKWDGKWRIVIFDVPETKKKMRNFFRQKLSDLGYRILQKSVWICPYNTADYVEELIEYCKAKPYIHYLLVEEIDDRDTLMELFKLRGSKTN